MKTGTVCQLYKYGYCKYKATCRNRHEERLCEIENCSNVNCEFRHPKDCRYFRDLGRCKFNPCAYAHKFF